MQTCDVAIVGLGIIGSAALYNLARRGVDAVGFDPLVPGEKTGSSHGSCRIYRRYNFESPAYTALSTHAFEAWSKLETAFGKTILLPSPLIEAGVPGSTLVRASRAAAGPDVPGPARGGDINAMFPAFRLPDDWDAVVQESAGILLADVALRLFREGAAGRVVPQAVRIERTQSEIVIAAADGTPYRAKQLIVAAGPWVSDFVPRLKAYVTVTRQAVGWFRPSETSRVRYRSFPLFILDAPKRMVYGFPDFEGEGVKAASHDHGRPLRHADEARQDATPDDLAPVAATLADYIPAAAGRLVRQEICLYTNTKAGDADGSPSQEFILDRLPDDPRVIVASPCSGHGFKFASAIGEILADMATDDRVSASPDFRLTRFAAFR